MTIRILTVSAVFALSSFAADIAPQRLRMFKPLPEAMPAAAGAASPAMIELGRMLYYENRISKSQKFSCNSCHPLDNYGVDNQRTSEGHGGKRGDRNSPTSYNAAGHLAQFWDGRAADVEEQAKGPILNPVEMAMPDEASVIAVLESIPQYVAMFKRAFPRDKQALTYDNIGKAIGAFERGLVTPSRWDKFLLGDKNALTAAEKAGFNKFYESGCIACHSGTYVGGTSYQKLGAIKPFPQAHDVGRFNVTKSEPDKMVFKVPSLRNVEKTWPYLHDGSVRSLDEMVKIMAKHQVVATLSDADIAQITTFLRSLTGSIPKDYIKQPVLPPSTAKTPKPILTD